MPNRFSRYMEMSGQIMAIFRRYDPDMCPGGCDEAYLKLVCYFLCLHSLLTITIFSITRYCEDNSLVGEDCVHQMREEVFRETKLTVSAGIAPNKVSNFTLFIASVIESTALDACEGGYIQVRTCHHLKKKSYKLDLLR